jgi:molybdenum cofactor biosynthesis enzyme MoaA
VILVDSEKRQDLRLMPMADVLAGVQLKQDQLPDNRLRSHLESCALTYGCPAAKNFFLQRYEAPLPTSPRCNARCLGCLSSAPGTPIPTSQNRISFTPSPEEIAAVALAHIASVTEAVVSFGQGCEGDPLQAADVILPAIRIIRANTPAGTIHMNTNGSRPDILDALFDAGLDSVRISTNSFRKECYRVYFRPHDYRFKDVIATIDLAIRHRKFVSINYLSFPGFTDSPEEVDALADFLKQHQIHMIQWRNLNFDPLRYWKRMNSVSHISSPIGMKRLLSQIREDFPSLRHGYFNPPRESFRMPPVQGQGSF